MGRTDAENRELFGIYWKQLLEDDMPQDEITLADARSYINDGVEGGMVKFRRLVYDHETLLAGYLIAQSIVRAAEIVADAIDRLDR